jgi:hypothetical protein
MTGRSWSLYERVSVAPDIEMLGTPNTVERVQLRGLAQ